MFSPQKFFFCCPYLLETSLSDTALSCCVFCVITSRILRAKTSAFVIYLPFSRRFSRFGKWSSLWCVQLHARYIFRRTVDGAVLMKMDRLITLLQISPFSRWWWIVTFAPQQFFNVSFAFFLLLSLFFWHINGNNSAKWETRRHQLRRNSFAPLPFSCEACDMNYFMFEWMLQMCIFMANKQADRHTKHWYAEHRVIFSFFVFISFRAANQIAIQAKS